MKNKHSILGLFLLLACAPLAAACGDDHHGDDDGHEEDLEGLQQCCWIGQICHSEDNATFAECHDLGHENDPTVCRANFERCKAACAPESTLPEDCEDPSGDPH